MLQFIRRGEVAIEEEDVTIVVYMLSQMSAAPSNWGETATVSSHELKRSFPVPGGTADWLNHLPEYDYMVTKLVMIFRMVRLRVINGERYIDMFDRSHDGRRCVMSFRRCQKMSERG